MKWISAAFMAAVLASVAAVVARAIDFELVIGLLGGPMMLIYILCVWRLYRTRRREGKRTPLPGYWELETELWEPLEFRDKLWTVVFCSSMLVAALAALRILNHEPQTALGILPLSLFAAISYVLACYRSLET